MHAWRAIHSEILDISPSLKYFLDEMWFGVKSSVAFFCLVVCFVCLFVCFGGLCVGLVLFGLGFVCVCVWFAFCFVLFLCFF